MSATPGWYEDPYGNGERYWDGDLWTTEVRPASKKRRAGKNDPAISETSSPSNGRTRTPRSGEASNGRKGGKRTMTMVAVALVAVIGVGYVSSSANKTPAVQTDMSTGIPGQLGGLTDGTTDTTANGSGDVTTDGGFTGSATTTSSPTATPGTTSPGTSTASPVATPVVTPTPSVTATVPTTPGTDAKPTDIIIAGASAPDNVAIEWNGRSVYVAWLPDTYMDQTIITGYRVSVLVKGKVWKTKYIARDTVTYFSRVPKPCSIALTTKVKGGFSPTTIHSC